MLLFLILVGHLVGTDGWLLSAVRMKTAKALGLTIPPSLLARADQVIE